MHRQSDEDKTMTMKLISLSQSSQAAAQMLRYGQVFASFKEQEGQRAELMRTVEKQRRGYEKKLREVTARHQKTDAAILQTSEENAALKQQASKAVSSALFVWQGLLCY